MGFPSGFKSVMAFESKLHQAISRISYNEDYQDTLVIYPKKNYFIFTFFVTSYGNNFFKMDILENSGQILPHTCCDIGGKCIFSFDEVFDYFKEIPVSKIYIEDSFSGAGNFLFYRKNSSWTTVKCAVLFLSLHHRAIVSANHPLQKLLRGEF